jgi:ethanolamine utilization protein EutQ (cupin superfamily)
MPRKINSPSIIKAAGNKPKIIEEFIGRVNSKTDEVSIARMKSPGGWIEPGQAPNFDEYTVVLTGELHIKTREDDIVLKEGEAVITKKGEWI